MIEVSWNFIAMTAINQFYIDGTEIDRSAFHSIVSSVAFQLVKWNIYIVFVADDVFDGFFFSLFSSISFVAVLASILSTLTQKICGVLIMSSEFWN